MCLLALLGRFSPQKCERRAAYRVVGRRNVLVVRPRSTGGGRIGWEALGSRLLVRREDFGVLDGVVDGVVDVLDSNSGHFYCRKRFYRSRRLLFCARKRDFGIYSGRGVKNEVISYKLYFAVVEIDRLKQER